MKNPQRWRAEYHSELDKKSSVFGEILQRLRRDLSPQTPISILKTLLILVMCLIPLELIELFSGTKSVYVFGQSIDIVEANRFVIAIIITVITVMATKETIHRKSHSEENSEEGIRYFRGLDLSREEGVDKLLAKIKEVHDDE